MICSPIALFSYAALGFAAGAFAAAVVGALIHDVPLKLAKTRLEIIGALVEAYDAACGGGPDAALELERCMDSARRITRSKQ